MSAPPTFTETFWYGNAVGNTGGVFSTSIAQVPQVADYAALYRQYRINWVKVMLLPDLAATSIDVNTMYQNNAGALASAGLGRIAYAINDTPALPVPLAEQDVLQDNGAKVVPLRSKWSVSYKPVVTQFTSDAAGGAGVALRSRNRPFLSFDLHGADPLHYGVSYWISHYVGNPAAQTWRVYMKVNFSLRDPK